MMIPNQPHRRLTDFAGGENENATLPIPRIMFLSPNGEETSHVNLETGKGGLKTVHFLAHGKVKKNKFEISWDWKHLFWFNPFLTR